jgi:Spy/CpxP family protein refolding chaperone
MKSDSRTRLATLGVLVLVFLAGVAVGFVLDRSPAQAAPGEEAMERRDARPHVRGDGEPRRFIIDRVDLSAEQRVQVDSVLDHFRHRLSDLTDEYQDEYRETIASARDAVRALLNEEQRAAYDSLLTRNDERRRGTRAPDPSKDES